MTHIPHIPTCAQLEYIPCMVGGIMRADYQHRWSGWPGAYCLDCRQEDKNEVCIGMGCMCECHAEFWKGVEEYFQAQGGGDL